MAQLPTDSNGKWECQKEAACCELFAEFTLGTKICPLLQEDKKCGCYEHRPQACRVSNIKVDGLDWNEYMVARCAFIHKLKEWKDQVGENKSVNYILEKISKSGLQ